MNYFAVVPQSGGVVQELPAAAGTDYRTPPALACYIAQPLTAEPIIWLKVSDGYGAASTFCGLSFANGRWNVVMVRAPFAWWAAIVVVY